MLDAILEAYSEDTFLKADGYDNCIIGVDEKSMRLIYSVEKIIETLMESGMSSDDAQEWYEFNIVGAYMGEKTPVYCEDRLYGG